MSKPAETPCRLLSIAETATLLNVTERFLARLIASGELASVKLGRRRLITRAEIDRLIESRTVRRSA